MFTSAVKITKNHRGLQALRMTLTGTRERATMATRAAAMGTRPQGALARKTDTMKTTMITSLTRGSMACIGERVL